MDGVINGDLLAIGNDININGEVNGDLAVIGKNVTLNGPVSGNIYISALFWLWGLKRASDRMFISSVTASIPMLARRSTVISM